MVRRSYMKKPVAIGAILLLVAMFAFQGCSSGGNEKDEPGSTETVVSGTEETGVVLTLEELSEYDGKNGNPAYIAVDGVIYDVTDIPMWKNGDHNGFSAGRDLSDEIKNISPHGVSKLGDLPVVGKLEE